MLRFILGMLLVIQTLCGEEKGRLRWDGLAEKEGFKPGLKECLWCYHNDQSHCESSPGSSDECRLSAGWPPTLRPSQSTWAARTGSYRPHPPSPFVITVTRCRSVYMPAQYGRSELWEVCGWLLWLRAGGHSGRLQAVSVSTQRAMCPASQRRRGLHRLPAGIHRSVPIIIVVFIYRTRMEHRMHKLNFLK